MFLSIFKMMLNAERCSVLPSSTVPTDMKRKNDENCVVANMYTVFWFNKQNEFDMGFCRIHNHELPKPSRIRQKLMRIHADSESQNFTAILTAKQAYPGDSWRRGPAPGCWVAARWAAAERRHPRAAVPRPQAPPLPRSSSWALCCPASRHSTQKRTPCRQLES